MCAGVANDGAPCEDAPVPVDSGTPVTLETLVDRMFDRVLEASERAELLAWIRAWEAANPDVDNAHRVTGWIDVAYAFASRSGQQVESRERVRTSWSPSEWNRRAVIA
jgi:hypothetical protein